MRKAQKVRLYSYGDIAQIALYRCGCGPTELLAAVIYARPFVVVLYNNYEHIMLIAQSVVAPAVRFRSTGVGCHCPDPQLHHEFRESGRHNPRCIINDRQGHLV